MKVLMNVVMKVLIIASVLFSVASAHSDESLKSGYVTTFYDPFVGRSESQPSVSNWLIDLGTSYPGGAAQWGNGEAQTYTSHPSNLAITERHTLAITPQLSALGIWTSGRIETARSDFACAEGGKLFIEARLKVGNAPASSMQGIWPAFWALGSKFRGNYSNWPMVSEWDIMENVNGLARMYTTLHCGFAPGGPCNEYTGIASHTDFTRGEWHTVGFEVDRSMTGDGRIGTWQDEILRWYLDGRTVSSITGARVNDEQVWTEVAHEEHFLLLNVAVGGWFPNAIAGGLTPTSSTIGGSSVRMEVDYVGVWNSV